MAEVSKAQLAISNSVDFPDNTSGLITPAILRGFNTQMIDSLVDEIGYTADSASFSSSIAQLQSFSSSLDATFATDAQLTALSTSVAVTDSGQDSKINSLINATGSYITSAQTASMTVASASFAQTASFLSGTVASASFATLAATASFLSGSIASASFATSASFAVTSSLAQNVVIIARNGNASTLGAGTIVHITGASGDNPIFNTASFDSETLSANTLGVLRQSAASGADVDVLVNGIVTGVDTDPALGYVAGDIIYLSSSGQFTKVQPQAPQQIVTIGQVLRAQQNNGSIYVNISNGWELDELHNVRIVSASQGEILAYNSASALWENSSSLELGLATTGSNNFIGNENVTGSLFVSGGFRAQIGQPSSGNQPIVFSSGSLGQFSNIQLVRSVAGANDTNAIQIFTLTGSVGGGANQGMQTIFAMNNVINTSSFISQSTANIALTSTHKIANFSPNYATLTLNAVSGSSTASIGADNIRIGGASGTTSNITFTGSIFGGIILSGSSAANTPMIRINGSGSNGNALEIFTGSVAITTPQGSGSFYTNLPITSSNGRINGTLIAKDLIVSGTWGGAGSGSFSVEGRAEFSSSVAISGSTSITGSAPTHLLVSGGVNYSGSLLSNATDTYPSVAQGNFVVTLSSASMATLLSGGTTDANTLYFVV